MRTRHSLTAAVVALIAIVVGAVISMLAGNGPTANAETPGPVPGSVQPAPSSPATAGGSHDKSGKKNKGTGSTRTHKESSSPKHGTSTKPSKATDPTPPRLGAATVPEGATYAVSRDGQAFTMVHSTLEAGTEVGRLGRSLSTTVPVSGDANLVLGVSGYVLTEAHATARLTVRANGSTWTRTFRSGSDLEFVRSVDVPLRGVRECRIAITVEVLPGPATGEADGYLNVTAVDGRID